MGALPPPPHWLPRDDFLLKNAAEAGASFESLARGAVQFSRRFTVQELQERWISLLYDPVISEEASAKMLEFECLCAFSSKLNDSSFDNDNKDFKSVCGKRQTKSVKRYYYSMRKRIRNEAFLSSIDVDFLTGSSGNNNNNNNDIGDDCNPPPLPPDSSLFGDSLTDQFGFIDNSVFPSNEHNIPENISGTEFEVPLLNSPFGYSPSSEMPPDWNDFTLPVDDDIIIQSEPPNMEDQMGISTPSTDDLLAQIDSILNSTSDDDMFPIDNIENESYLDTYGSLLLDSPNSGGETEKEENAILPNEPSVQKAPLHYYGGDQVLLSSALSVNPACPELRNGVICCTLNTEDPDIPSNDDVFLPIRIPSTRLPSAVLCKYDEAYRPPFKSEPDVQMNNRWSFMKMREKSNMGVPSSNTAGGVVTRNTSSNEGLKEITSPRIATTTTAVATRTTICALPAVATTKKTLVGCSMNTPQKQELFSHDPIANTSMLDQEDLYDGDSDGDLHDDDSDGDIPNFSDVEALILDMDLSPDDRDIFNKKVAKYQHQQTKRTIMRLERAADAHIQRLIASQKAFAVLYSRSSTHFIKKPEVLVGRGTADTEVDIDLSREFRGNKISRRQAIIKINMDGAFFLQNVSKHLIHVNGKEIMPRQSVHLTQSSLIEVRGMTFVFEMNRNQVKRLVDGMKHNQES